MDLNVTGDDVAAILDHIATDLGDLTAPNREAADLVLASAQPPRRTGRLAGSLHVDAASADAAVVVSDLPYAGVIHNGWPARQITAKPFLTDALATTEPQVIDVYAEHLADILRSA